MAPEADDEEVYKALSSCDKFSLQWRPPLVVDPPTATSFFVNKDLLCDQLSSQ